MQNDMFCLESLFFDALYFREEKGWKSNSFIKRRYIFSPRKKFKIPLFSYQRNDVISSSKIIINIEGNELTIFDLKVFLIICYLLQTKYLKEGVLSIIDLNDNKIRFVQDNSLIFTNKSFPIDNFVNVKYFDTNCKIAYYSIFVLFCNNIVDFDDIIELLELSNELKISKDKIIKSLKRLNNLHIKYNFYNDDELLLSIESNGLLSFLSFEKRTFSFLLNPIFTSILLRGNNNVFHWYPFVVNITPAIFLLTGKEFLLAFTVLKSGNLPNIKVSYKKLERILFSNQTDNRVVKSRRKKLMIDILDNLSINFWWNYTKLKYDVFAIMPNIQKMEESFYFQYKNITKLVDKIEENFDVNNRKLLFILETLLKNQTKNLSEIKNLKSEVNKLSKQIEKLTNVLEIFMKSFCSKSKNNIDLNFTVFSEQTIDRKSKLL